MEIPMSRQECVDKLIQLGYNVNHEIYILFPEFIGGNLIKTHIEEAVDKLYIWNK